MPKPEQSLKELTDFLDNSIDSFSSDIPDVQDQTFKRVQTLLKDLDLRGSNVKASASNLRKINRIKREIEGLVLNNNYLKDVGKFGKAFEKGTNLQTDYFKTLKKGFDTPDFIKTLQKASIDNTTAALTESGIQSNIVDKAGDIIQRNITESASFSDLIDDMRTFLTETPKGAGALKRYTSQIVTDSLNTYAAEYNRFVSDNLNMQWYVYSGSLVKDSRSFCISLVKKHYVHKSEFGKVSRGQFTPTPSDLKGLKPGTDAKTLQTKRGGYNCNHLLTPIAEEFVPESIKAKFAKATTEKPAPPPPPVAPKVKPKKVFNPAKTIKEAEQFAVDNKIAEHKITFERDGVNLETANKINSKLFELNKNNGVSYRRVAFPTDSQINGSFGEYLPGTNDLLLNKGLINNPKKLDILYKESVASGYFSKTDFNALDYIITHESGHSKLGTVKNTASYSLNKLNKVDNVWKDYMVATRKDRGQIISIYANSDFDEFMAESFVSVLGGSENTFANKVFDIMME